LNSNTVVTRIVILVGLFIFGFSIFNSSAYASVESQFQCQNLYIQMKDSKNPFGKLILLGESTPLQELIGDLLVEILFYDSGGLETVETPELFQFRKFIPHELTVEELDKFSMLDVRYKQDPYRATLQTRRVIAIKMQKLKSKQSQWKLFNDVFAATFDWLKILNERRQSSTPRNTDLETEIKDMNEFMISRLNH
jgi:hypothetical protein